MDQDWNLLGKSLIPIFQMNFSKNMNKNLAILKSGDVLISASGTIGITVMLEGEYSDVSR